MIVTASKGITYSRFLCFPVCLREEGAANSFKPSTMFSPQSHLYSKPHPGVWSHARMPPEPLSQWKRAGRNH